VLVTGAAGYIASYLLPAFRERYELRLVDVRPTDGTGKAVEGIQVRDVSDPHRLDASRDLFRGLDAVVHLAFLRPAGPSPTDRYFAERGNVDMAYAIYQLALEESVRRVVVASSNHAADFYEGPLRAKRLDLISPEAPRPLSDNYYGWAKESYEHLGFVYASGGLARALDVVQIRIGAPRDLAISSFVDERHDDPVTLDRDLGMWVSPRDLAQLFVRSIETPSIADEHGVPFQVFYGISGNTRSHWSLANARRVIGYAPRDNSEVVYADQIRRVLLDPLRPEMVDGEARGGLGHR
ncbi:MAG: NAD-dependent epimerase/dehydratase family protein, partial [Chloroflexota bacterium]